MMGSGWARSTPGALAQCDARKIHVMRRVPDHRRDASSLPVPEPGPLKPLWHLAVIPTAGSRLHWPEPAAVLALSTGTRPPGTHRLSSVPEGADFVKRLARDLVWGLPAGREC